MIQSHDVTFQVNDSSVKGYFASAPNPTAGIIVLHAWWGLTPFFKQFCDRLANEGYAVFAPDMFKGQTASTIAEAEALVSQSRNNEDLIQAIVEASVEQLRGLVKLDKKKLGVIGFSFGAAWAVVLSASKPTDIGTVVLFYGAYPGFDFKSVQAAFQGHFAEHDDYEPLDGVRQTEDAIKSAGLSTEFYVYPNTGHWFFEDNQPHAYDPEAAQLAWQRTRKFLHDHLD